ncbi:MAG: pyruvate formate lyase family protein [Armatimonadota bacterium]
MAHNLDAIQQAYLASPDEAVFLERALILDRARREYADLPPGLRQGMAVRDLCAGITPVVKPFDVLPARVKEVVPNPEQDRFIECNPDLFISPGLRGFLDAASIYIPDWEKLLRLGIGGLISEAKAKADAARSEAERDLLAGVILSLEGFPILASRYAAESRRVANAAETDREELLRAAVCCERIATHPPETFRDALQLFALFHMVLSCLIGGRDITPGRMDQYLLALYRRDLAKGRLTRAEAAELLAVMMVTLPQLSGHIATDFQSAKRTPTRFSHYYITLGGVTPDGGSAVNELSFVFLEARRLVEHREPTLVIRYQGTSLNHRSNSYDSGKSPELSVGALGQIPLHHGRYHDARESVDGIDEEFWTAAVELMRDRLPVFPYNDAAIIPALIRNGIPLEQARDYAHCACMHCFLPGHGLPPLDEQHNGPRMLLLAMNAGRDLLTGDLVAAATPEPEALPTFDDLFAAFRAQLRASLSSALAQHASSWREPAGYPLLVHGLFDPTGDRFVEQRLIGLATTVDSLLAIERLVYRDRALTLRQFASILRRNFQRDEKLRQSLASRDDWYGSDDPGVLAMVQRVGTAWAEEVTAAGAELTGVRLRPNYHSWLYHLEQGRSTPATPDGRSQGEPLSIDFTPAAGRSRTPTEVLHCMASLPHELTCSGGSPVRLSPSHFEGPDGLARLSALLKAYFAQGGMQLHLILADAAMLRDAVERPDQYRDLLVRVTGFSEHFVRLLPEVQQDLIRRAE